jgi:GNAT superfamily N-acetyltransferase
MNQEIMYAFPADTHCDEVWKGGDFSVVLVRQRNGRKTVLDESIPSVQGLIAELSALTARSFGMPLDESSSDGTRAHLQGVDALALLYEGQRVVGFASGFFPRAGMFYLHGIAVAPEAKGKGTASVLVKTLWAESGLDEIAFTTQNPIMFALLRSLAKTVYPNPRENIPSHLQMKATELMQGRPGTFNPATGGARNLYNRCLYNAIPKSSDEEVDRWFGFALGIRQWQTRHALLLLGEGKKT